MKVTDLIPIGNLIAVLNSNGLVSFKPNRNFIDEFLDIEDVFVVFTDDRVRYLTIEQVLSKNNKILLKFLEEEVFKEIADSTGVKLMLDPQTASKYDFDFFDYKEMKVVFEDKIIGKVVDNFYNSQYMIFNVVDEEGNEILIPNVDEYVTKIDFEKKVIYTNSIDLLKDI